MMKDTMEIRWHGRGGQGAKTAALLLADVAFKTGLEVEDNDLCKVVLRKAEEI